ncbi:MAG: hypothetical protein FWD76_00855 [Firmicutes bacterium]|nr:hypothetical protein [Bacillota bacterium]
MLGVLYQVIIGLCVGLAMAVVSWWGARTMSLSKSKWNAVKKQGGQIGSVFAVVHWILTMLWVGSAVLCVVLWIGAIKSGRAEDVVWLIGALFLMAVVVKGLCWCTQKIKKLVDNTVSMEMWDLYKYQVKPYEGMDAVKVIEGFGEQVKALWSQIAEVLSNEECVRLMVILQWMGEIEREKFLKFVLSSEKPKDANGAG